MPSMFQVPTTKIDDRKDALRALFAATTEEELLNILESLPTIYLYIEQDESGPPLAVRALLQRGLATKEHRVGRFSLVKVVRPARHSDDGK
jgi:hypothetical protein